MILCQPGLEKATLARPSAPVTLVSGSPERPTLVAHAAGLDPARLSADVNLAAQVAGTWNPASGGFGELGPQGAYYTALGILALARTPLPSWALVPAVEHLRGIQESDGSWSEELISTADMTATSVAALCEAGAAAYDPAVASAFDYLKEQQTTATGAIEPGNAESSSSLVSALTACGIDSQSPRWTTAAAKTPIDYLISLQATSDPGAGGFAYAPGEPPNLYSTAFALRAIAGGVFTATPPSVRPVPAVATGTPVPHLLAIQLAPANVRMCKVTAPAGAPLTEVLSAAKDSSYPAGCVTSFTIVDGQVESIDGVDPENRDEAWLLRLDRGAESIAGDQAIGFGDMVSLRLGRRPSDDSFIPGPAGETGATGPGGKAGDPGAIGKRGAKGRPGRRAWFACRAHRRHAGKRRIHCAIKHRHRRPGRSITLPGPTNP